MKASRTFLALTLAAASLAAVSGTALAWRGGGDRSEHMIERAAERLELDADQRAALESLAGELRETRELMRGEEGALRESVRTLVSAETLDQGAALQLIEARAAALQAQAPELVAAAALFLDGLTPEQKADVERFLERAPHGHRGHHGHRDGARDGERR